jgi:hypothetical protein
MVRPSEDPSTVRSFEVHTALLSDVTDLQPSEQDHRIHPIRTAFDGDGRQEEAGRQEALAGPLVVGGD